MTASSYCIFILVGIGALLVDFSECGCREAGLCCFGREAACLTKGWRSDRTYGTCFCDQACVSTMDCCDDYGTACPAVSCEVSEWTQWSGCAETCRAAVRRRSRTVLKERVNGGEPCPHLEEQAGCAQYWTEQGHCHNSLGLYNNTRSDFVGYHFDQSSLTLAPGLYRLLLYIIEQVPALITSSGYGNARKKRQIPDSEVTGYCVRFQLTSLTDECAQRRGDHTQWMQYLREGHHVCVECQPPALATGHCSGDGENLYNSEDRRPSLQWQAVGNPRCRGVWRRVERLDTCSCPTAHSFLFI